MDTSVKKIFAGLGIALFISGALFVWFVTSLFVNSENLFEAAQNNDLQTVRKLLNLGTPATTTAGDFSTPALLAATNHDAGNVEMVTLFLQRGADANQASTEGDTPLQTAAAHGNVAVMKLLLSHGAKVDTATHTHFLGTASGETPLILAARYGHVESVKLLLAHGANVTSRTSAGRTALQEAKLNTHEHYKEVVALLRKAAAQSNERSGGS